MFVGLTVLCLKLFYVPLITIVLKVPYCVHCLKHVWNKADFSLNSNFFLPNKISCVLTVDPCDYPDACGPLAACVVDPDSPNRKTCECDEGYQSDGSDCQDIDECSPEEGAAEPCGANMNCVNTEGGYNCVCKDGYQSVDDNSYCEDINECSIEEDVVELCGANMKCVNREGGYECECKDGFVQLGNGDCAGMMICCISQWCVDDEGRTWCCSYNKSIEIKSHKITLIEIDNLTIN